MFGGLKRFNLLAYNRLEVFYDGESLRMEGTHCPRFNPLHNRILVRSTRVPSSSILCFDYRRLENSVLVPCSDNQKC